MLIFVLLKKIFMFNLFFYLDNVNGLLLISVFSLVYRILGSIYNVFYTLVEIGSGLKVES